MKQLFTLTFILFSILLFGQQSEKIEFNHLFNSLDKKHFNYNDFADSIQMFVFMNNELGYNNKATNFEIIQDLNVLFTYVDYDKFEISEACSDTDKGFIATLYLKNKFYTIYLVLNNKNKINVILIK